MGFIDNYQIPDFKKSHADKQYMESGSWRCSDSPTGTHHWIITRVKTGEIITCKYCKETRRLSRANSLKLRSNKGALPDIAKSTKL